MGEGSVSREVRGVMFRGLFVLYSRASYRRSR